MFLFCRKRRDALSIFVALGFLYTQQAHWMLEDAFLAAQGFILSATSCTQQKRLPKWYNLINNQPYCCSPVFAGGSLYDLGLMRGISHSSVYASAWMVVNAVKQCNELSFDFSLSHKEQCRLANLGQNEGYAGQFVEFDIQHPAATFLSTILMQCRLNPHST